MVEESGGDSVVYLEGGDLVRGCQRMEMRLLHCDFSCKML